MKRMLAALALMVSGWAWAGVEVNKSTATELTQIKGIGPAIAERIVVERKKGGDFKSWADLVSRVKGVGDATASKFSEGGLTVNGQALKPVAPAAAKAAAMPAGTPAKNTQEQNNQLKMKK